NGDSPPPKRTVDGVEQIYPPTTAEAKLARKNELKARDPLGKFDGKAYEGFFVGYSMNSKAFRVFNSRTKIVEETLHITFLENKPNVAGSGLNYLFDIDTLTKSMNYKPVVAGNQSNGSAGKARVEIVPEKDNILLQLWTQHLLFSSSSKDSLGDGFKPSGEEEKKDAEDPRNEDSEVLSTKEPRVNQEKDANVNSTNNINTVSPTANAASTKDNAVDENIVYECADDPNMPNLEEIIYSDEDVGIEADYPKSVALIAIGAIGPPPPFKVGRHNSSIVRRSGTRGSPFPSVALSKSFKRVGSTRDLLRIPPLAKLRTYMLRKFIIKVVILTNLKGNNQGRNQFFQGASHGQNPPPAYQASGYQALVHQAPIPQPQVVTTTEFTNYVKANDDILKNMQTNMTSLTNSNLELKNMFGHFMKMNAALFSGSGTLPSNTITNPKEDLKGITTQSGNAYQGPTIPTTSSSPSQVVECETEMTKDTVPPTNNRSTKDVQPSVVQIETSNRILSPLLLPRSFLKTGRALIGVYEGELTLRVGKEVVTFNLDQTSRYSTNYDAMSVNRIDLIDVAYEEYSHEVLRFSMSGNPTPSMEPIVSNSSATLTPFGDSDFLLEETDAFLAIDDELISLDIDGCYYDSEGDILLIEEFLNDDPSSPPLPPQELKDEEKTALIKVLKSHKQALTWQLSDIKDPQDQENTTFTYPYGTFAYRRMPFGLCNAPGTFQRCMMAIFHDMIEKTMEVFMDDFSVFGNSFETCLSHLDKMLKWYEDTNLCLN
nr:reverse transcriptase domain-containing protein [Tanacetum cinerariifolium]